MKNKKKLNVMVDLSATLIHHGHIRLLRKAFRKYGKLIIALTTDIEVKKQKGAGEQGRCDRVEAEGEGAPRRAVQAGPGHQGQEGRAHRASRGGPRGGGRRHRRRRGR